MSLIRISPKLLAVLAPGLVAVLATWSLPAQWVQAQPNNLTPPLTGTAMAARPNGQVILFGGENTTTTALSGVTRWWDGGDWYVINSATAPSARKELSLVHDTARDRLVLFGGWTGSVNGETWEFDGAAWSQKSPANTPGARWKHGTSYDIARGRTVLYGGATGAGAGAVATTWEYDGVTWQQIVTGNQPGPREDHAMCYHQAIARTVLFGGLDPALGVQGTTWLFNGVTWTQLATSNAPSPRSGAQMVYDGTRGVTILFGGADAGGNLLADTWEFNGVDWVAQPTTTTAGRDVGIAFDSARRRIVRYSGLGSGTVTWRYGAYTDGIGSGCMGSNGQLVITASAARIGESFSVFLFNMAAPSLGVVVLSLTATPPIALDALGMPGCNGYMTPDVLFVAAGSGGTANWSATWQNNLNIIGTPIYVQGLALDPGWNAAGLVTSNAVLCLVGH